jgi:uncharacterized phage protein (TIGR01671 family)
MREIKFRAWDTIQKRFLHIDEIDEYPNDNVFFNGYVDPSKHGYGLSLESEYIEFLLYTGLKDKNGREIYEGDILELGIQKGILKSVVEYHSPTFCHRWINLEEAGIRGKKIEPLFWNTNIIFEVIGNVYENPELLEGTE